MSGLIGKKIGMTSLFDEEGKNLACTVIQAGPCIVTQVKNEEKDGYNSVQLGFFDKKENKFNNAETGHFKKAKTDPKRKVVEFKGFESELNLGDVVYVDHFTECEYVDVSGNKTNMECDGLLSTCIQHEINHLDGKLIIDFLSKLKKDILIKKLSKNKNTSSRVIV